MEKKFDNKEELVAYICNCGQKAKIPLCFDCFKKGLEFAEMKEQFYNSSPMLYKLKGVTWMLFIWVMIGMLIGGILGFWFNW